MFYSRFRSAERPRRHLFYARVVSAPPHRYRIALWAFLTITLIVGCARQYHWYRCGCGCVNYNYCPPAPLPYTPYCSCPTPIANSYQRELAQPSPEPVAPNAQSESEPVTTETLPE